MATNTLQTSAAIDAEVLWDKRKLARFLGVGVSTIDYWIAKNRAPRYFKVGCQVRFNPGDVAEFLDQCRRDGAPGGAPSNGTTHKARAGTSSNGSTRNARAARGRTK